MTPARLYTVCLSRLPVGAKVAQTGHAIAEYAEARPDAFLAWKRDGQYLVCLQAEQLEPIISRLQAKGFDPVLFHEPDFDNELTAIAIEGSAGRWLSSLGLVK